MENSWCKITWFYSSRLRIEYCLAYWGRNKMAAILQTAFSNGFLSMNVSYFDSDFSDFFPMVRLTISQRCFRYWLGTEKATSHYLKQKWPSLLTHICVTLICPGGRVSSLNKCNPIGNNELCLTRYAKICPMDRDVEQIVNVWRPFSFCICDIAVSGIQILNETQTRNKTYMMCIHYKNMKTYSRHQYNTIKDKQNH